MARKRPFNSWRTHVAGTYYYGDNADQCHPKQAVDLRRNPDNPHDKNAVEVWVGRRQIGHIPRDAAGRLAQAIDQGQHVEAHVVRLDWMGEDDHPTVDIRVTVYKPGFYPSS